MYKSLRLQIKLLFDIRFTVFFLFVSEYSTHFESIQCFGTLLKTRVYRPVKLIFPAKSNSAEISFPGGPHGIYHTKFIHALYCQILCSSLVFHIEYSINNLTYQQLDIQFFTFLLNEQWVILITRCITRTFFTFFTQ